ncbi:MAG: DUF4124 domain-containing protein [Gallionellaceae bacterium]|nr:DUF4124 domain-containing protein [Gallionellaceae bacterium]
MGGYTYSHHPLSRAIRGGLTLAALLAATAGWAATYRWVDEKGGVHYGDSIPAQYAGQGHLELNAQGRVIKRVEQAPTSAQARQLRQQAEERKAAEERETLKRERHDNALLATYGSVLEIEQARKRELAQVQATLDSLQAMRLHSASKANTDYIDQQILLHRKALEDIQGKYDADKARYIELSGPR